MWVLLAGETDMSGPPDREREKYDVDSADEDGNKRLSRVRLDSSRCGTDKLLVEGSRVNDTAAVTF